MSTFWIIATVVALLAAGASIVVLRRRVTSSTPESTPPAAAAPLRAEPVPEADADEVSKGSTERAEPAIVPTPPMKPALSEADLRSRVKEQLESSARMLGELREARAGGEGAESPLGGGAVEIMEEGLKEVRALADQKQWDQAREKGEALHAQLSMLLQAARRERAS